MYRKHVRVEVTHMHGHMMKNCTRMEIQHTVVIVILVLQIKLVVSQLRDVHNQANVNPLGIHEIIL